MVIFKVRFIVIRNDGGNSPLVWGAAVWRAGKGVHMLNSSAVTSLRSEWDNCILLLIDCLKQ